MIILTCASSAVSASQISFRFGDYAPANDMLYAETSSIESFIEQVKEFYRGLRPDIGENEILMLTAALTQKLGFNPLDSGALRSIGFDPGGPVAFSIENLEPLTSGERDSQRDRNIEKNWTAYIPASDALKLYQSIHVLIKRGHEAKYPPMQAPEGIITEISRNRLLHHKDAGFYLARGDRFCVFSNSKDRALAATRKAAAPLSKAPHYLRFRQHIDSRYTGSDVILSYCLNRKGMDSFYFLKNLPRFTLMMQKNSSSMQMYRQLNDEINQHVLAEGGMFSLNRKKASMRSDSLYRDGYLPDRTKILPGLLFSQYRELLPDSFGKTPALYGRSRFNLSGVLGLMKAVIPDFDAKFGIAMQEVREKTGADLGDGLIDRMNGNFAVLVDRFPETGQPRRNVRWDISFAAGYNSEDAPTVRQFFDTLASAISKEGRGTTLQKEQYGNGILWNIITRKKKRVPGQNFPQNQQPVIKETNFLYLGQRELIYTPKKDHLIRIMGEKSSTSVAGRCMNISSTRERNSNLLLYLDMEKFNSYINTSQLRFLIGPAAQYLQNMESIRMIVENDGKSITSETMLMLK